ncbi:helix-turn-helix domain-containing protein [Streptomyces nanhaiensis]|uniref:helix-turn-helix domain-containing protein n=1 Tax=Streptomyces nanhaiensis TaxID=679319 RepID=UPI00399CB9BE
MEKVDLCVGAGCRSRGGNGTAGRRTPAGGRLCAVCHDRLAADLRRIPRLYDACGRVLGGGRTGPRERTSGGHLPGMPFNTAAFEVRSAMLGVLGSWASLVAEERGTAPPRRAVPDLAAFLTRHLGWLSAHCAVGDLTEEVARLVRRAGRLADPDPVRRVRVGRCAEPDCRGTLVATLRPEAPEARAEIRCDAHPDHRWAGSEWTRLGRHVRRGRPGPPAGRTAWLTADEISRLWGVPSGSVYRLASERRWSRHRRGGRTYYDEAEVREALRGRAGSGR